MDPQRPSPTVPDPLLPSPTVLDPLPPSPTAPNPTYPFSVVPDPRHRTGVMKPFQMGPSPRSIRPSRQVRSLPGAQTMWLSSMAMGPPIPIPVVPKQSRVVPMDLGPLPRFPMVPDPLRLFQTVLTLPLPFQTVPSPLHPSLTTLNPQRPSLTAALGPRRLFLMGPYPPHLMDVAKPSPMALFLPTFEGEY